MLTDTDNMLSEVKVLSVEAEQAEPQLPHRLSVLPILWPATGLQVDKDKNLIKTLCETSTHTKICKNTKYSQVLLNHQRSTRSSHLLTPQAFSFHHKSATNSSEKD